MDEQHEPAIAQVKIWWRQADQAERQGDELRWQISEELFNLNVVQKVPQTELADAIERSQGEVSGSIKVWRFYGIGADDEHGTWSYNECYQRCKKKGIPKGREPDPDPDDLGTDSESDGSDDADGSDYYLGNTEPLDAQLLDAIGQEVAPEVLAGKVTEEAWESSREEAEAIYYWVTRYVSLLEDRFMPLDEAL